MLGNAVSVGDRCHIGFFGRRNAGKSSLVNAVTGQMLSVVSDTKGTTTDPVYKTMELLPLGPVVIIDTPGIDDEGELGALRVARSRRVLNKCDIAVLVADAQEGLESAEEELLAALKEKNIPTIIAYNKSDIKEVLALQENEIAVSAKTGEGVETLKERLARLFKTEGEKKHIVSDLLFKKDHVVLVTPIDEAAPKGRIILPQQQTLRDILDAGAYATVVQPDALAECLNAFAAPPKLVITDSQVFGEVSQTLPEDIPLTSFSILMARYKGYLEESLAGVRAIEQLTDGDRVLIAEGCTHHRQCNDIGTVKIPNWLKKYTGKEIQIETVSGGDFPEDLSRYRLVVHCGGCMLGDREVRYRMKCVKDAGVPVVNYGILIAQMKGILNRSIAVLPEVRELSKE